jgi:hypothetical protein
MSNQGFTKTVPPLVGKNREAFQITYVRICLFESNTPHNKVFIFHNVISDTAFRIFLNPFLRAVGWVTRRVLWRQVKTQSHSLK